MRNFNCLHPNRGFSLVEVMVVLVLFAVGTAGLSMISITTIRSNATSHLRTKATSAIQDKIESLRLDVKAGKVIASGTDTLEGLNREWTVYENQPSVGLTTVVVQIHWNHAPIKDARFLQYASILGTD